MYAHSGVEGRKDTSTTTTLFYLKTCAMDFFILSHHPFSIQQSFIHKLLSPHSDCQVLTTPSLPIQETQTSLTCIYFLRFSEQLFSDTRPKSHLFGPGRHPPDCAHPPSDSRGGSHGGLHRAEWETGEKKASRCGCPCTSHSYFLIYVLTFFLAVKYLLCSCLFLYTV